MARKATPIGPYVLAMIEDARVDLARAAFAVREVDDAAFSRQSRHRSFNSEHDTTVESYGLNKRFRRLRW